MVPEIRLSKEDFLKMNRKDILVLCYCFMKSDRQNKINIVLNDLKRFYNISISNKHNNDDFKNAISRLEDIGYLSKEKDNVYTLINKHIEDNFIFIGEIEIIKMKEYQDKGNTVSWEVILPVYLTIKSFVNMSNELKYCYCSQGRIGTYTDISKPTIAKALNQLSEMKLIKVYDFGVWRNKKGISKRSNNVYALTGSEIEIKRDYEIMLNGKFLN